MYAQSGPSGSGGGCGQIVTVAVNRGDPVTYIGQCKSSFRPAFSWVNTEVFFKPCTGQSTYFITRYMQLLNIFCRHMFTRHTEVVLLFLTDEFHEKTLASET